MNLNVLCFFKHMCTRKLANDLIQPDSRRNLCLKPLFKLQFLTLTSLTILYCVLTTGLCMCKCRKQNTHNVISTLEDSIHYHILQGHVKRWLLTLKFYFHPFHPRYMSYSEFTVKTKPHSQELCTSMNQSSSQKHVQSVTNTL